MTEDWKAWERHVAAMGERLLDCGRCATEDGVEVHPHPECTVKPHRTAAMIDYATAAGGQSLVTIQAWDVPWESGSGKDETTGATVKVMWTGDEWKEIA
jgi:hypothetical protein